MTYGLYNERPILLLSILLLSILLLSTRTHDSSADQTKVTLAAPPYASDPPLVTPAPSDSSA